MVYENGICSRTALTCKSRIQPRILFPLVFRKQLSPDIKYEEKRRPPNVASTAAVATSSHQAPRTSYDNDHGVYDEIHATQRNSAPSHVTDSQQYAGVASPDAFVTSSQQQAASGYEQLHPRLGDGVAYVQPYSALRQ